MYIIKTVTGRITILVICLLFLGVITPQLHQPTETGQKKQSSLSPKKDCGRSTYTTELMDVSGYGKCRVCCGRFADGVTASGHVIRQGDMLIAGELPFGTMITVPGYGRAPVLDRGGSITEGRLDVLFHSHQAALEWGRQTLLCEVER